MESLLAKVKKSEIVSEPFPYLVVKDVLDEEICSQLIAEFPELEIVTKGAKYSSNERFSYGANDALNDPRITPLWQEFIKAHISQQFLDEIVDLFGEHILDTYPDFEQKIGKLAQLQAGTRRINSFLDCDVLMDAQICVNTPVVETPSSVRGAHVDSGNKLFAALYYLRNPQDTTSTGGNLEIYRYKGSNYHFFDQQFIHDEDVEVVKTINYERNVLVFFLNSPDALHGVTVREVTNHTRYFFNLLGEVKQPLFKLTGKVGELGISPSWLNFVLPKYLLKR